MTYKQDGSVHDYTFPMFKIDSSYKDEDAQVIKRCSSLLINFLVLVPLFMPQDQLVTFIQNLKDHD